MISSKNKSTNFVNSDSDFTLSHYRQLLDIAISSYTVVDYSEIPFGSRFLLWRHDVDLSLNRSLALAKIEHEQGLKATYFINPHSEFYNIAETKQHAIVKDIIGLGHDLGVHFDAAYFQTRDEEELHCLVTHEAEHLADLFQVYPSAFSFHNPTEQHLTCEADSYGGLVNCYSRRFKEEIGYCSDSNGYWRYERLHDVLLKNNGNGLQVLTHPGWWQNVPITPRRRIFRAAYGRAAATMQYYDTHQVVHGRINQMGKASQLHELKTTVLANNDFALCDYLWNQGYFTTLLLELWRIHEQQIARICSAYLTKKWNAPVTEVNRLLGQFRCLIAGWVVFDTIFSGQWTTAAGISEPEYLPGIELRDQLFHGGEDIETDHIEDRCVALCCVMLHLADWWANKQVALADHVADNSSGQLTDLAADGFLGELSVDTVMEPRIENSMLRALWQRLNQVVQGG